MPRDLHEWVTDQLLTLYTCHQARRLRIIKRTRLQKTIFLSEYLLWDAGFSGFNYQFTKQKYGPYSSELTGDLKRLEKNKLIKSGPLGYRLINHGFQLLKNFGYILEKNQNILSIINDITQIVMDQEFEEMLAKIYATKNPINPSLNIEETPINMYLLSRETKPIETEPFEISEDEAEDLEMVFDPQLHKELTEARVSIKNGELVNWSPLMKGE